MSVTFVGAGSLASAMAVLLQRAGYTIEEIVTRDDAASRQRGAVLARMVGAQAATMARATLRVDIVWLAVNDDAIAMCADALAQRGEWKGRIALHSSGALASDEMEALRQRGAHTGSLHPMMTFVKNVVPELRGVSFAIEGNSVATTVAKQIVRALGGTSFAISKENKGLYHAFGAFISPLLVAQLTAAEEVARAAGVPQKNVVPAMAPIILRTLENYFSEGGAAAFSGPLLRGDVNTIERHVAALKDSGAAEVYRALATYAVKALPVKNWKALEKVLKS
ncbi:MAG TPA: DUF2520 domain-containing protein [Clostridia bacterium]|nr:DUF2520 domain-containing protein [Clostridia bacterium]